VSTTCCPLESGDGYDSPSFCTTTTRRAAKEHACCECHETITRGDRYEYTAGCWEGDMSTYKTCLSCVEIRNHFACNGWLFGRVWSDIEENFFPDMKAGGPCMAGLSPAAKGRLFDRRIAWLEASQ
jgi:hypothetical protein